MVEVLVVNPLHGAGWQCPEHLRLVDLQGRLPGKAGKSTMRQTRAAWLQVQAQAVSSRQPAGAASKLGVQEACLKQCTAHGVHIIGLFGLHIRVLRVLDLLGKLLERQLLQREGRPGGQRARLRAPSDATPIAQRDGGSLRVGAAA